MFSGVGRQLFRVMAGGVGADFAAVVGFPGRYAGARAVRCQTPARAKGYGWRAVRWRAGGSVPEGCVGADFAAAASVQGWALR